MRNMYIGDGALNSHKRDCFLLNSGHQPTRMEYSQSNLRLMSPRPFSINQSICEELALKGGNDNTNAATGVISQNTDEIIKLRKQVSII